jgi:hypothetical protein
VALVRLTDKDGKDVWVNSLHVRTIAVKSGVFGGKKGTEIALSGLGGMHGGVSLIVAEDPETVASLISEALLHLAPLVPLLPPEDEKAATQHG